MALGFEFLPTTLRGLFYAVFTFNEWDPFFLFSAEHENAFGVYGSIEF